jgi:hypothetical protein
MPDHAEPPIDLLDAFVSDRRVDQLRADLRAFMKLDKAVLAFEYPAQPHHMRELLPENANALESGARVLAAIQHVHRVGQLGVDAYVQGTGAEYTVTTKFPIAEISEWTAVVEGDEPVIKAEIRFAPDPIAVRVSVKFTIGYQQSVDGTTNLVYRIRSISEEEARDPRGS